MNDIPGKVKFYIVGVLLDWLLRICQVLFVAFQLTLP